MRDETKRSKSTELEANQLDPIRANEPSRSETTRPETRRNDPKRSDATLVDAKQLEPKRDDGSGRQIEIGDIVRAPIGGSLRLALVERFEFGRLKVRRWMSQTYQHPNGRVVRRPASPRWCRIICSVSPGKCSLVPASELNDHDADPVFADRVREIKEKNGA